MNKHVVAPLVLLSSITLLTSCMGQDKSPVPVVETPTETSLPVEVITAPMSTESATTGASGTTMETDVLPPPPEPPTSSVAPITRTEVVTYQSPAGPDPVEFSVTVIDGVITSASAIAKSTNQVSQKFQSGFAAAISEKAIGMKTADFKLDTIAGASLTTDAFEQYVRSL